MREEPLGGCLVIQVGAVPAARGFTMTDGNMELFLIKKDALVYQRHLHSQTILPQNIQYINISPFICAPMVHQSELMFRLLCQHYNVSLAATLMLIILKSLPLSNHFATFKKKTFSYNFCCWYRVDCTFRTTLHVI